MTPLRHDYHFQNRHPIAGPQIVHFTRGIGGLRETRQGRHMTLGQINHMDVVAHARPVPRLVVPAKYTQTRPSPHRYLRNVRHKVVWWALRVLANPSARMRPNRVEVAQNNYAPLVDAALCHITQHLLDVKLGTSVCIGGAQRMRLVDGQALGRTIHSRCREEPGV